MRKLLLVIAASALALGTLWFARRPAPASDPYQAALERIEVARARGQLDAAAVERLHAEAMRDFKNDASTSPSGQ